MKLRGDKMSAELKVRLSDHVLRRIQWMAENSGQDVGELVDMTLDGLLPPLPSELDNRPVESLTDSEVLLVADSMMDETLNSRMNALVQKQKKGLILNTAENTELQMLWDIYEVGQLRKAQAMVEAVKRGLREARKS
jgi:hypothetical protein